MLAKVISEPERRILVPRHLVHVLSSRRYHKGTNPFLSGQIIVHCMKCSWKQSWVSPTLCIFICKLPGIKLLPWFHVLCTEQENQSMCLAAFYCFAGKQLHSLLFWRGKRKKIFAGESMAMLICSPTFFILTAHINIAWRGGSGAWSRWPTLNSGFLRTSGHFAHPRQLSLWLSFHSDKACSKQRRRFRGHFIVSSEWGWVGRVALLSAVKTAGVHDRLIHSVVTTQNYDRATSPPSPGASAPSEELLHVCGMNGYPV